MDTMHGQAASTGLRTPGSTLWAAIAAALALTTAAFGGQIAPNFLYGIDDAGVLWKIDVVNLTSGSVSQTSLPGLANAVALDARGNLLAVDGNNDLWCINDTNLQGTKILTAGTLGLPADLTEQPRSAAFYDDAYWFFVGGGTNGVDGSTQLRKLTFDYTSGTPQVTGFESYETLGVGTPNAFGDIAITTTGKLYAYTSGNTSRFYSLDLTTIGTGTTVSGYTEIVAPGAATSGVQIAFRPNGTLYGNNWNTGEWYSVDTTTGALDPILTGSGTFTTIAADGRSFRDLAGSSIQAVPEPDTLALAAMGGGVLAWQVSRRRKKPLAGADDGEPVDSLEPDDLS